MVKPQPVCGFRSKTAAVAAFKKQGLSAKEIAEKIGVPEKTVYAFFGKVSEQQKRRRAKRPRPATRGWTPEKCAKAIRLYQMITEEVATALNVPPGELLSLWVKGTLPQMDAVPVTAPAPPALAFENGPGSEIDEPEPRPSPAPRNPGGVSASAFNPRGTAPAKVGDQVRLRTAAGKWLHLSGEGLTEDRNNAWIGNRHQARNMRRQNVTAGQMQIVQAEIWQPRDQLAARELSQ